MIYFKLCREHLSLKLLDWTEVNSLNTQKTQLFHVRNDLQSVEYVPDVSYVVFKLRSPRITKIPRVKSEQEAEGLVVHTQTRALMQRCFNDVESNEAHWRGHMTKEEE